MQTREEQPNMEGLLYASQSGRELITVVKAKRFFTACLKHLLCNMCRSGRVQSGPCLPSRFRVQLSNNGRVRVGSVQHIYGSLRVHVHIFGPVKTSTSPSCHGKYFCF